MQYVYVAGLEHSGTTLLGYLLGRNAKVMALGEVGQFLCPQHMKKYIEKWGEYPDVRLCSCGKDWTQCEFWGPVYHLSGLNSSAALKEKYEELLEYCRSRYSSDCVFVDSSKTTGYLALLLDIAKGSEWTRNSCSVLWAVKDVRCFASSINRKTRNSSLARTMRTFNWWLGANTEWLKYLDEQKVPYKIVLYERLCMAPRECLAALLFALDRAGDVDLKMDNGQSHIVLSNKDFVSRNRAEVKYDHRWFLENKINIAYLLHRKARRMNEWLYRAAV